jgi:hypothetical protein
MLNEKRKSENSDKPEPNEAVKLSGLIFPISKNQFMLLQLLTKTFGGIKCITQALIFINLLPT